MSQSPQPARHKSSRAGGHTSDITDNVVREYALPLGVVDVKVAAIDDDWSGLRLVWRKENRRRPS